MMDQKKMSGLRLSMIIGGIAVVLSYVISLLLIKLLAKPLISAIGNPSLVYTLLNYLKFMLGLFFATMLIYKTMIKEKQPILATILIALATGILFYIVQNILTQSLRYNRIIYMLAYNMLQFFYAAVAARLILRCTDGTFRTVGLRWAGIVLLLSGIVLFVFGSFGSHDYGIGTGLEIKKDFFGNWHMREYNFLKELTNTTELVGILIAFVGGVLFFIGKFSREKEKKTPNTAVPPAGGEEGTTVKAFAAGTVRKISVANGQAVRRGDLLFILEVMNAECEITAPVAGTVTQITASVGDTVAEGAALAVISETDRK